MPRYRAFVRHPTRPRVALPIPAAEWREHRADAEIDARAYALLTWPTDLAARNAFKARVRIIETSV